MHHHLYSLAIFLIRSLYVLMENAVAVVDVITFSIMALKPAVTGAKSTPSI